MTNIGTASGCTLDLNGFRITTSQVIIYENHVLTIIDSSEKKTGSMGALWVSGYAFRYEGGSYVAYDAADDLTKTVSVVPCDYEGWYSSDNNKNPVTLLQNISGDCAINSDVFIDMGSYSINGTLTIADGADWGSILPTEFDRLSGQRATAAMSGETATPPTQPFPP